MKSPLFLTSIYLIPKQIPGIPNWSLFGLSDGVADQEIQLHKSFGSGEVEDPIYAIS